MSLVRAVFCDLDGTLIDTKRANAEAYRTALGEVGLEFDDVQAETSWGADSRDFLVRIYPQLTGAEVQAIRKRKAQIYPSKLPLTSVNTALVQVLQALKPGRILGLVTTAKRENALSVLRHHNLAGVFDFVVNGDDVVLGKPAPDAYLLALRKSKTAAEHAVAFEDSVAGVTAAEAAGIHVVQVACA